MNRPLDASHWRAWRGEVFPDGSWRIAAGELQAIDTAPRVDLVSHERFADFIFGYEFCLPAAGNSGVLYRASEAAELSWQSGPEVQLLDDARHPDGQQATTRNGALYALRAPTLATPIEPGRFVSARLVVRAAQVEHWFDGRQVLAYRLDDPALREAIGHSKFAPYPGFGAERSGHLVLQHHGDAVRFRNLWIDTFD
ncbi:DUF1080 domain-containing protein [Stutzerimonas nosocomialis]|uniref:DUF1080 domain-containing protein n=1 Tax=Stutzerimonas nosocomialis TaxID=1056496 RepID=A0A5R9QHX0_9GAMM|nr:DUF1080 domain-containing protein [Stutzerimonas nosocomialis]TLX58850.1 DUF1080 domain-containing protein [Stutzerimonas nosocomialis]TLX64846.1 DUF1080 domain-containing protein [Stutzerimonas nosocomialis]